MSIFYEIEFAKYILPYQTFWSFSQTARLNCKQKKLYIKITCFKGHNPTLETGDFSLYSDWFSVFRNGYGTCFHIEPARRNE